MVQSDELRPLEFTPAMTAKVSHFDCGSEPWETEVSDWIKARGDTKGDSALTAMRAEPPVRIWLYINSEDRIVGFGSLGQSEWRWPNSKRSHRTRVGLFPMLGIHKEFQGKPANAGSRKYCYQIVEDLLAKAKSADFKLVGLFVHKSNLKARHIYKKIGFSSFPPSFGDNDRMLIDLAG